MSKHRYIIATVAYLLTGFILAMGIIDTDPVIRILCVLLLMLTTWLQVINTWYILR